MKRETHITSYFSLPTDLAGEMRDWPEFVAGQEYSVDLTSADTGERVSVRYVKDEEDLDYVTVRGEGLGTLYDRVLGRVIHALGAHSDHLMVHRRRTPGKTEDDFNPTGLSIRQPQRATP